MKKLFFALTLIIGVSIFSIAGNDSKYYVDDIAVDQLFANSTEISLDNQQCLALGSESNNAKLSADNDAIIAWLICWAVGEFGIHRHYLGTKDNMWAIYTFTCCGIFGIVPMIDWWVLLIDGVIQENIGRYQNNDEFFMWAN